MASDLLGYSPASTSHLPIELLRFTHCRKVVTWVPVIHTKVFWLELQTVVPTEPSARALFFQTGSLTVLEAHHFAQADWPISSQASCSHKAEGYMYVQSWPAFLPQVLRLPRWIVSSAPVVFISLRFLHFFCPLYNSLFSFLFNCFFCASLKYYFLCPQAPFLVNCSYTSVMPQALFTAQSILVSPMSPWGSRDGSAITHPC